MDFTRYDQEIADLKKRPLPARISQPLVLLYGSSTFTFWGHERAALDLAPYTICNHGFGGSTAADALMQFDSLVKPVDYDILALYEGDNDMVENFSADDVHNHIHKIIQLALAARPQGKILIVGVKPSPCRMQYDTLRRAINQRLEILAKRLPSVVFVSLDPILLKSNGQPDETLFLPDMLHLNEAGYARLAQWLKAGFRQALGD